MTPHYSWQIDQTKLKITGQEVMQQLADTKPIGIGSMGAGAGGMRGRDPNAPTNPPEQHHRQADPARFGFAMWQLKEGEDKIIANRLVEIFSNAPKA